MVSNPSRAGAAYNWHFCWFFLWFKYTDWPKSNPITLTGQNCGIWLSWWRRVWKTTQSRKKKQLLGRNCSKPIIKKQQVTFLSTCSRGEKPSLDSRFFFTKPCRHTKRRRWLWNVFVSRRWRSSDTTQTNLSKSKQVTSSLHSFILNQKNSRLLNTRKVRFWSFQKL